MPGERDHDLEASDSEASGPGLSPEIRVGSVEDAVREVASEIEHGIHDARREDRPFVLGVATGATMEPLYAELGRRHREQGLTFGRVVAFALDEYCGLPGDHPDRMRAELGRILLDRIDLPPEQLHFPDVDGESALEERCERFERDLRAFGGVDLWLLGVGSNGHVAFNEPGSAPDSRTRRVHLADSTRRAAASRFGGLDSVPTAAITAGLATIRRARRLRLLASGPRKADAVAAMARGVADTGWPATQLLGHADLVIHADHEAASGLTPRGASTTG